MGLVVMSERELNRIEVFIIGVDLAKRVFQIHGADASGKIIFRKKLSRPQFAKFLKEQPNCIVAMEACASAHHWGREALALGHEVRLVPARYVKPFVKRHKSDVVDAEAITEYEAGVKAQAPWQKGSVENLNKRARRYLPRDTPISMLSDRDMRAICERLNGTPRKCLGWQTPAEAFAEELRNLG